MNRFIEFCILSGCDYLPHLAKIGAKTAFQLLAREGSLQAVVEAIKAGKGPKGCSMPDSWDWPAAKELFLRGGSELPDPDSLDLTLGQPDLGSLHALLVEQYQFNVSRVDSALDRLRKTRVYGGPAQQRRIETYFKPAAQQPGSFTASPQAQPKRKHSEEEDRTVDSNKQQCLASESSSSIPGTRNSRPELVGGAPCPAESSGQSFWACSRCTFANASELPYCEMCEAERIESQCEPSSSSSSRLHKEAFSFPPSAETPAAFVQLKASKAAETCVIDLDE